MNIVFDYKAVIPHTVLTVNGEVQSELYGDLGAVCRYPLQSWLYPRGSWKGLRQTLEDLARGRDMQIEFVGREVDFADFALALKEMKNVKLTFRPAYEEDVITESHLADVRNLIRGYPRKETVKRFEALLQNASANQQLRITSAKEYAENLGVLTKGRSAVLFSAAAYRSVARELHRMLLENFARPSETIVVLVGDNREKAALLEEVSGTGITVALESKFDAERFFQKYGGPEVTHRMRELYEKLATELDALSFHAEKLREENRKIARSQQQRREDGIPENEKDDWKYDANAREIHWMGNHSATLKELVECLRRHERKGRQTN